MQCCYYYQIRWLADSPPISADAQTYEFCFMSARIHVTIGIRLFVECHTR